MLDVVFPLRSSTTSSFVRDPARQAVFKSEMPINSVNGVDEGTEKRVEGSHRTIFKSLRCSLAPKRVGGGVGVTR